MSSVLIRKLNAGDLPFAQDLRQIAGWNQTDADWRRLIELNSTGCFLAEVDSQKAGTATITVYGNQLAWIGMVLVHPRFRRQGLATALLSHCLKFLLDDVGVTCVKLDATAEGERMYAKLGLRYECRLNRWYCPRRLLADSLMEPALMISGDGELAADMSLRALDQAAFGADRADLLLRLAADSRQVSQRMDGSFGMYRDGAVANYLGPIVASSERVGRELVLSILGIARSGPTDPRDRGGTESVDNQLERPIYWDVPSDNHPAEQLAERLGFVRQRPLIRMWIGRSNVAGNLALQWAITGPETG
jgi:RimJ/RimL family protein N-acetyltransferase